MYLCLPILLFLIFMLGLHVRFCAHSHSFNRLSIIFCSGSFIHIRTSALPSSSLTACLMPMAGREQYGGKPWHRGGKKNLSLHNGKAEKLKMIFFYSLYLKENSLPGREARAERCQPRIMTCLTDRETHTYSHTPLRTHPHMRSHTISHAQSR